MTMDDAVTQSENLRQQALAAVRSNQLELALELFEKASNCASEETQRELLTINKAGVLITLQRTGPEIQQLPSIVLRRENPRHVYLAAYNLHNKFSIAGDFKRAYFYARIALEMAEQSGEQEWRIDVLFALGILSGLESRFGEAIAFHDEVLEASPDCSAFRFRRALTLHNLGYSHLQSGDAVRGTTLIHEALGLMSGQEAEAYSAECHLDLALAYLETGDLDQAEQYGRAGLAGATENRQVRNAHYLLGEIAYKREDLATASSHFQVLASYYPDFPNLSNLLLAIDLRGMVNFKL